MKFMYLRGLCNALAALTAMTTPGGAANDPLQLEVRMTSQQIVTIQCSFDPAQSTINTVDELSIYGSRPNSKKGSFQNLASVDRWNTNPQLFGSLAIGTTAKLNGSFGFEKEKSDLNLSWPVALQTQGDYLRYKCAVRGTDLSGQPIILSETTKILGNAAVQASSLEAKLDSLAGDIKNLYVSVDQRLTALEDKVKLNHDIAQDAISQTQQTITDLDRIVKDVTMMVGALNDSVKNFSNTKDTISKLESRQKSLSIAVTLLAAQDDFKLSHYVHNSKIYMVQREKDFFDMNTTNSRCSSHGGYLAEINDSNELDFVLNFLKEVGSGNYVIGASYSKQSDKYTYHHSGDPVPDGLWSQGEPIKYSNDECVAVDTNGKSLATTCCTCSKVKYVCEIPLDVFQ